MYLVCRTIGLSDYRGVGLLNSRTIEMSYYRSDHVKEMAYAHCSIFSLYIFLCLTCNSGRGGYWKFVDILLLQMPNDILQCLVNANIRRVIEGLKDKMF